MTRILVVGGGFTGLATAHLLQSQGHRVTVWEAAATPGGKVRTLPWPGPSGEAGDLDAGPEGLRCARGSALDTLMRSLDLPLDRVAGRGPRWILDTTGRHLLPRGLGGWLASGLLPLPQRLRLLLEPFMPSGAATASLEDLARHRFGPGFADRIWPALIQGLVGAAPTNLDGDLLPPLRRMDRLGGTLAQALREGVPRRFRPRGGMGKLTEALARDLDLHLGCPAASLRREPEGWSVQATNGAFLQVERVILALPAPEAAPLLAPHAPALAEALASLPHTDLAVHHTRHVPVPGWEAGVTLLVHPERPGSLGTTTRPLGGLPWLQARTYLQGPEHSAVPEGLPELGPPLQAMTLSIPHALPRPVPGQMARLDALALGLPHGLEAIGPWRWGPGLGDLAEGVQAAFSGL